MWTALAPKYRAIFTFGISDKTPNGESFRKMNQSNPIRQCCHRRTLRSLKSHIFRLFEQRKMIVAKLIVNGFEWNKSERV